LNSQRDAESKKVAEIDINMDDTTVPGSADTNETAEQPPEANTTADGGEAAAPAEEDEERLETIAEEDGPKHNNAENASKTDSSSAEKDKTFDSKSARPPTPVIRELPDKGPEVAEFAAVIKAYMEGARSLINAVGNHTGNEPVTLDINKRLGGGGGGGALADQSVAVARTISVDEETKGVEELGAEAAHNVEKMFKFVAVEFDGALGEEEGEDEGDEEEEGGGDAGGDAGGEEEEEEEEEEEDEEKVFDPSVKEKSVSFGETCHYCPVVLSEKGILQPGNPELQLKYRERFYRFSNEEARAAFMENPEKFLPTSQKRVEVPPPRILVMGVRGSGKSTQARFIAERLNIFHIKFRDYLQELVIGKTKKRVEAEHDEEKVADDVEEDDEDDDEDEKEEKDKAVSEKSSKE
jgi:YHS domain-containing protein